MNSSLSCVLGPRLQLFIVNPFRTITLKLKPKPYRLNPQKMAKIDSNLGWKRLADGLGALVEGLRVEGLVCRDLRLRV